MPLFSLPLELFHEIFSHLADHRHFIREHYHGRATTERMEREHVERSITIRRLTMTCWSLRNQFLPLLWRDVEGCVSLTPSREESNPHLHHLYAKCIHLSSNPAIAAYVQTFSVILDLAKSPEDLMIKLVECISRLPNLKTLEILRVQSRGPISPALRRKHAIFPSVRELCIAPTCHQFIRSCPNLETLTFTRRMTINSSTVLLSYGRGLNRVAGVDISYCHARVGIDVVIQGCPNLQEIGMIGTVWVEASVRTRFQLLRQLKHLAVVDIELVVSRVPEDWEETRVIWKKDLLSILKDSPSAARKVLRWKVVPKYQDFPSGVVENEDLEVCSEEFL